MVFCHIPGIVDLLVVLSYYRVLCLLCLGRREYSSLIAGIVLILCIGHLSLGSLRTVLPIVGRIVLFYSICLSMLR